MPPSNNQNAQVKELLDALRQEFYDQQTTPIQDKKLTVPVALATVIIFALVASTWKVSSFYEKEINTPIQTGIRERTQLKSELADLKTDLNKVRAIATDAKSQSDQNKRDIDYIWDQRSKTDRKDPPTRR